MRWRKEFFEFKFEFECILVARYNCWHVAGDITKSMSRSISSQISIVRVLLNYKRGGEKKAI